MIEKEIKICCGDSNFEIVEINECILDLGLNKFIDSKIAIAICLLTSICCIAPFHCYFTTLDYYFNIRIIIDSQNYEITLSSFPIIYMSILAISFIILIKYYSDRYINHHLIILYGFLFYILIIIILPFLNLTNFGDLGSISWFFIILIFLLISAIIDGLLLGSVFSLTDLLGSQYLIFCQIGIGLAGIIILITRLICKLSFSNNEILSDEYGLKIRLILFYSLSLILIITALLSLFYLKQKNEESIKINNINNSKSNNPNYNKNYSINQDNVEVEIQ